MPSQEALGKATVSYRIAVTATFLCRMFPKTLGKVFAECPIKDTRPFADLKFAEGPLPSAVLGKAFAESNSAFAECRSSCLL